MSELLAEKAAIVTGGASGIGRGIALALAEHGADVVVADIQTTPNTEDTTPTIEAIEERTDSRAKYADCDVTEPDDVAAAVESAEEFGGIDVMVNNAGIIRPVEFLESTEEDYYAMLDVHLKGTYLGCREAAKAMVAADGGSIVNVASTAVDRGFDAPGAAFYCAAKGGIQSMTFALGEILGPEIRVNAIKPGYTAETGLDAQTGDDEMRQERAAETAMGRLGLPEDLGNAAVFLASDLSGYVTSEAILVEGGWVHTGGP